MVEQFLVFGKRVCLFGFLENLVGPNEDNAERRDLELLGPLLRPQLGKIVHCPRLVPINCTEPRINRPFYQIQEILPPFRSPSIVPSKVPLGFCNLPHISKSADVTALFGWFFLSGSVSLNIHTSFTTYHPLASPLGAAVVQCPAVASTLPLDALRPLAASAPLPCSGAAASLGSGR